MLADRGAFPALCTFTVVKFWYGLIDGSIFFSFNGKQEVVIGAFGVCVHQHRLFLPGEFYRQRSCHHRLPHPALTPGYGNFHIFLKIIEIRKIEALIIIIKGPAGKPVNLKSIIPKKADVAPKDVAKKTY